MEYLNLSTHSFHKWKKLPPIVYPRLAESVVVGVLQCLPLLKKESWTIEDVKLVHQSVLPQNAQNKGNFRVKQALVGSSLGDVLSAPGKLNPNQRAILVDFCTYCNDVTVDMQTRANTNPVLRKILLPILTLLPPPPGQVESLLTTALAKHEELRKSDPVTAAAFLLTQIGYIHPFEEGNGRVARTLCNLSLMRSGLPAVYFPMEEYAQCWKQTFNNEEAKAKAAAEFLQSLVTGKSVFSDTAVTESGIDLSYVLSDDLQPRDEFVSKWKDVIANYAKSQYQPPQQPPAQSQAPSSS